jgi:formamidase
MLACRKAVLNMMKLQEPGFCRQQADVICSVAVGLRVSNLTEVPNYVVFNTSAERILDGAWREVGRQAAGSLP